MASKIENAEQLDYSKADSNDVDHSENATQLARKSSAGALTQGQPQERTSSSSDAHAAHGSPSFQRATPEELGLPASPRITHERNASSNDLPEMQARLDELLLSRDHAIEASERSQRELAEVRAELEARKSELAAIHLRLTGVEDGWAESKAPSNSEPERPNQQPDNLRILQDQFGERGRDHGHRYSYTEDASVHNSEFLESSVDTDSKHYSDRRSLETASHSLLDVLLHSSN